MARLAEDVNGKDKVRLVFRLDRFGRGGDHRPFVEAGLPAVRFTEPLEDYRHEHQTPRTESGVEYGDLPKFMDFDFVARDGRRRREDARGDGERARPSQEGDAWRSRDAERGDFLRR